MVRWQCCWRADNPRSIDRLIVVDIAPKDYFWVGHRAEFAAMSELQLEHLASRAEAELRFEARVDDWSMRKFLTTNLDRGEDGRWRWLINLPALIQALPVLEKNPLTAEDHFDGPTLFVTGERSTYVSPKDHENHPPAFSTIPKAGHNPHMDQREAFVGRYWRIGLTRSAATKLEPRSFAMVR